MAPLLKTKLHRPAIQPKRVHRPALIQHLDDGLAAGRMMTLVSAPAGYGKTSCVAEWAARVKRQVTWLSLDSGDDDPGRFFTYFIAAMRAVDETFGQEIEGPLNAGQVPPEEIIAATLAGDMLRIEKPFTLVLDDLHSVQDASVLRILERIIENPPKMLHLLLVTREDPPWPLARLRGRNRLSEIRAQDLRFTPAETTSLMNNVMGLSLSHEDIAALNAKTEGWAVGLHLAGLTFRDQGKRFEILTKLSGNHRHVLQYLTEEVLKRQSDHVQQFLRQTAILDTLTGDLCDRVSGRKDSHALLEKLHRANLFLVPVDDAGHWYRYHQLFAELLRDHLKVIEKENVAELHRRAAQWYTDEGMIREAIQHTLAAEDYETAVYLIESHAMDLLMQWHIKTVEEWTRSIPTEWLAQSPGANLTFAWMYLMRGDYLQAAPYCEQVGALFAEPETTMKVPVVEAKWLALQGMMLCAQAKHEESLGVCKRALELAPKDDAQLLNMIYLGLANTYHQMNDYKQAIEAFQKLIQLGETEGNSVSALLGISGLALLALQHGKLRLAFRIADKGATLIEQSGSLPPISTAIYGELAEIHYQWYDLDRAHGYFQEAIRISALSGYSDATLYYAVILSRIAQTQGDLDTAAEKIGEAIALMQHNAPNAVQDQVIAEQVRIHLARGKLAAAEQMLEEQGISCEHLLSSYSEDETATGTSAVSLLHICALRLMLCRFQPSDKRTQLTRALGFTNQLVDQSFRQEQIPMVLELLLIRAEMHTRLNEADAALSDYARALSIGETEEFISVFIEEGPAVARAISKLITHPAGASISQRYIQKVLDAFPSAATSLTQGQSQTSTNKNTLVEPLSKRELEVLRLIDKGFSNQKIAEKLHVTLHTVKKHTSNIYSKLGVKSRTQAVALARELRLSYTLE